MQTMLRRAVALTGVLACAGCGSQGSAPDSASPENGTGLQTATSSSGALVTLALASGPLAPGPLMLAVRVDGERGDAQPRSVDLVSPTMPMHGIVRTPLVSSADSGFVGRIDVPMEGAWALYVNLDDAGGDAAEFRFDVVLSADADHTAGLMDHSNHMDHDGGSHSHGAASAGSGTNPGDAPGVRTVFPITKGSER